MLSSKLVSVAAVEVGEVRPVPVVQGPRGSCL